MVSLLSNCHFIRVQQKDAKRLRVFLEDYDDEMLDAKFFKCDLSSLLLWYTLLSGAFTIGCNDQTAYTVDNIHYRCMYNTAHLLLFSLVFTLMNDLNA